MAIAFDTSASGTIDTNTVLTYSHTCTGSNLILWVVAATHSATSTINSITYNSVNLTKLDTIVGGNGTTGTLWYLLGPSTGANNVVVTISASDSIRAASASYTGCKQTGVPDAHGTAGPTTTTSYSQSLTTIADNCWGIWGLWPEGGATITAGSNTRIRQGPEMTAYGTTLCDTNSAKTPAGTDTMNVTSTSQTFFSIMATFAPFVASPVNSNFLMMM